MIKNVSGLISTVTSEISSFTDIAVVGLSGGADSTLVATLCQAALGKENVYGIHMPYNELDLATFNSRSQKLAKKLGIREYTIPVSGISDAITNVVTSKLECGNLTQINMGNARSRARMTVLYAVAGALAAQNPGKSVRVIGTGNLSEDFIGYDTKGGDALTDLFPIGELFKSEVYQLLEYFRDQGVLAEELIDRNPSAGLWDGQTDEAELGHSYNSMEPHIKRLRNLSTEQLRNINSSDPLEQFVVNRHLNNKHKHEAPPVVSLRNHCE